MCDATIVIESAEKGGSLITAELAEGYHRDCFAFPGRLNDEYSKGCNQLIRDNKASLLLSAEDFVSAMGWDIAAHPAPATIRLRLTKLWRSGFVPVRNSVNSPPLSSISIAVFRCT